MPAIDVIIPVRLSDPGEPESLRYALRSWATYVSGWRRLVILGHRPSWLDVDHPQIAHIASDQRRARFANVTEPELRFRNQRANIEALIAADGLSREIIWAADDIYAIRETTLDELPHYHRGPLAPYLRLLPEGGPYRDGLTFTLKILQSWGYPNPDNYATHTPAPILLPELARVMGAAWAEGLQGGFMRTLYPVAARTTRTHVRCVDPKLKTLDGHPDEIPLAWVSSDPTSYSVGALGSWLRSRLWQRAAWERR